MPPKKLLERGYDAVYLACGFPHDASLDIEGIDGVGVHAALDLLERVAHGERPNLGTRVLVIGGGNTAMDAARTAQRLTGHPSTVVYRRTQHEMPAEEQELEDLLAEGNALVELASPVRVLLDEGQVVALECVRNGLGEPDASGRRRPEPIPGSAFQIAADAIVLAIGQQPEVAFLDGSGVSLRRNGAIAVDEATGATAAACVYAGGDVARGPAIIIEACADGRRAAETICAQLGVTFAAPSAPLPVLDEGEILAVKRARARREPQRQADALPVERRGGFDRVEGTLSEADARAEAARCLQCSVLCDKCVEVCPNRANFVLTVAPVQWSLPTLAYREGQLVVAGEERFEIAQTRQIVHLDDLCNECGNCATFCVHQGKPYLDKPRLCLHEADFERETDNAFCFRKGVLRARQAGRESRLAPAQEGWRFENEQFRVRLSPAFDLLDVEPKQCFEGGRSLRLAAEMAVLHAGLSASLPFLLR
jgi:putative selenate reductase